MSYRILPMQIGLVCPNHDDSSVDNVKRMPVAAEAWGYDAVWFTDHVIGLRAFQPVYGGEWAEALTCLAYAAATTKRVRLGVGVLVLPVRDPVYAAKVLATIDQLSDGRLDIGIGTGWSKGEFHALGRGAVHELRGAATDEAIEVLTRLFAGGTVESFEGRFSKFRALEFSPTSVQRPHPPFWIGGQSGRAIARAARAADVWHPTALEPEQLRSEGEKLDALAGRKLPRSIRTHFTVETPTSALVEKLRRYAAAGAIQAAVEFRTARPAEVWRAFEALAKHLPELHGA